MSCCYCLPGIWCLTENEQVKKKIHLNFYREKLFNIYQRFNKKKEKNFLYKGICGYIF